MASDWCCCPQGVESSGRLAQAPVHGSLKIKPASWGLGSNLPIATSATIYWSKHNSRTAWIQKWGKTGFPSRWQKLKTHFSNENAESGGRNLWPFMTISHNDLQGVILGLKFCKWWPWVNPITSSTITAFEGLSHAKHCKIWRYLAWDRLPSLQKIVCKTWVIFTLEHWYKDKIGKAY